MKRFIYIYLITSFITLNVQADDDNPPGYGSITGSVVDALSQEPMPYVNVVVRNRQDSILTGGITDDNGKFTIKSVPEGNNKVEIQFIGYDKITKEIVVSNETAKHNLSTISLNESSQALEEVVVRAELSTVIQKIDRKVINVGKDMTATGTTASELLNNVQSVSVDSQTGQISLRGNENVRILVDGKPTNVSAAQLMNQIPSSSIKSIELITNPSAKYSPEGMSGIINIVLYKYASSGYNGNITSGLTVGKRSKYNGAINMNYGKGKVNLFVNYGGNIKNREGGGELWRTDSDMHSLFDNHGKNASHLVKTGADFYLNKYNTLSFYTTQNFFKEEKFSRTRVYYEEVLDSENLKELNRNNYTGTYNLNFKRDFAKEGHNLEVEASYSTTDKINQASYEQIMNPVDLTSNYSDDARDNISSTILNVDYTNPITENATLEIGLESRFRNTRNYYITERHQFVYDNNNMTIPDGMGRFETIHSGNSFMYDRNISAAYASYGQKFGKLSMQLGVRAEHYRVDAEFTRSEELQSYIDEKLTAYPSAYFTYAPSDKNQFQVSYSRRVDRPGINQVNPIRGNNSSPVLIFVGNPKLTPQYTNSYEFNYTRRLQKGSVSTGIFYRQIQNNIIRYTYADPLDVNSTIITWENAEGQQRYGFEMSGMYKPLHWWSINTSFDIYSQLMTGYAFNEYVEVSNVSTNVRMNNTFNVTENLSLQLFGRFRGATQNIQWEIQSRWMVNTGLSYKVFDKKGTITLRVNDIFYTNQFRFESINYYPSYGGFFWESRTFHLGYSHNFGNGEIKVRQRRTRNGGELSGEGGL